MFSQNTNIFYVALAAYTRRPVTYEALHSFKLLQLPCVRTLKYYIDFNLEEAGEVEKRLVEKKFSMIGWCLENISRKSSRLLLAEGE